MSDSFKSLPTGPVTGDDPRLIHDLPTDNLVAAMVALAGEVQVLRSRVRVLERELEAAGSLPKDAVERHEATEAEREADTADLQAFLDRFWSNLTRPGEPIGRIAPSMKRHLVEGGEG